MDDQILLPSKIDVTVDTFLDQGMSTPQADYEYAVYLGSKIGEYANKFRAQCANVYQTQSYRGLRLDVSGTIVSFTYFDEWLEFVCRNADISDTARSGILSLMEHVVNHAITGQISHTVDDILALDEGKAQRLASAVRAAEKLFADDLPEQIDEMIDNAESLTRQQFEEYLQKKGLKTRRNDLVPVSVIQLPDGKVAYFILMDNKQKPTIDFGLVNRAVFQQKTVDSLIGELAEYIELDNG